MHIVDGSGYTDDNGKPLSGLGNLIVGYDENATTTNGSHNIVCGTQNSFSSYGGLVAAYDNTISGGYATVTGGSVNKATDSGASVSGGYSNTASGRYAAVSGGEFNIASDYYSSVGGGNSNTG